MIKLFEEYNQYYTEISRNELTNLCGQDTYMIKLFEQYNQYYFETDSDEYYSNNSIIFNDNEIIQITEHLKRIGFDHIDYPPTKNFVYCDYTISDQNEFRNKFKDAVEMDHNSVRALNTFLKDLESDGRVRDCTYHLQGCQILFDYKTNEKVSVYPTGDDWFFCVYSLFLGPEYRVTSFYYKCDQIEGVIKLISDILSKTNI